MERSCVLLAFVLIAGCSSADSGHPKTYPATGTVTLNGKALAGATVTFYPSEGTGSSIGTTDADGKYTLTTFRSNDGALPGQYKVSITKFEGGAAPAANTPPPGQVTPGDIDINTYVPPPDTGVTASAPKGPKNLVPAKFANADGSGLRGLVEATDKNENNFDLK